MLIELFGKLVLNDGFRNLGPKQAKAANPNSLLSPFSDKPLTPNRKHMWCFPLLGGHFSSSNRQRAARSTLINASEPPGDAEETPAYQKVAQSD
jgi:hypothetical protein